MATVTAPPTPRTKSAFPRLTVPDFELKLPDRIAKLPDWARIGGLVVNLLAISTYLRTRYIGGQFWMDEALSTGIASHSLSAIPGVLRHDGSPPLYYLLLHVWIRIFGITEAATHSLSLVCSLVTVPVGLWAGWSLFGKRAGLMAATLFAFSAFLTDYAQETRMYALMALLGLLATTGFIHAFVYRRRKYLILFAVAQALMLYTHAWGIFFGVGSAITVLFLARISDEPRELIKDGLIAYAGAVVLFLPWLPNFIYQATHTAAPWDSSPRFGAPVQLSRDLLGGDRITVALLIPAIIGLAPLCARGRRRSPESKMLWSLLLIPFLTLLLAWLSSQVTPAWVARYFAPVLAPILLMATWGLARSGIVGAAGLIASILFLMNTGSFVPQYKSDMRDVSGELGQNMHTGDLVITAQPEQIALTWYYLPSGLRYASTIGPVSDPRYMNWVNALDRLRAAAPSRVLPPLIASLRPGQQVLFVRPLTEGAQSWQASWTQLIRRRAAQWGAIFDEDVAKGILVPVGKAPHTYRGACCVADSAVLYKKL
jgi:MFS family permease